MDRDYASYSDLGIDVRIRQRPDTLGTEIYIIDRGNRFTYLAKHVKLEFEKVKDGAEWPEPTLVLGENLVFKLSKALSKMLDERGIKSDSQSKIEGLLEATKYHLEDMRKIVFSEKEK